MEFKIDENLPVEVARLFEEAGHSCSTAVDEGLGGSPDRDIVEQCRAEGLVLVTLDVGFSDIRAYPPADYPGIVVLRLPQQDRRAIARVVSRLIGLIGEVELQNRLWVVDETRVRIRE